MRECGCNAIRTAHNPASEDFLDLCDEMGFLVQEEFFDEWDNPKDKRKNGTEKTVDYITRGYTEFFKDYAQQDLQNVIRRGYNHPGIFQWSIGNEIEDIPNTIRQQDILMRMPAVIIFGHCLRIQRNRSERRLPDCHGICMM